jgi:UPF0042 nucleotide-binding protein
MGRMGEFLVITGLAGAGRSTAAATFEDLGWFVIDNLPPALIGKVAELASAPGSETDRIVLAIGTSPYLDELLPALDQLRANADRIRIVFLEASDEVLVRRFEEERRRHPLPGGNVGQSVQRERALLEPVKALADVVIDTSETNVHQLRERLTQLFTRDDATSMQTTVMSFGYKYGIPLDADNVLDCRFLPNPHWIEELRPLLGTDEQVRRYVLDQPATKDFLDRLDALLEITLPAYVKEGKSYLTLAIGCTGGRHRSVVLAEEIAKLVRRHGLRASVYHRDVER